MIQQTDYVITRELLDTIIGRTDLTATKRRRNAANYAEALMTMATQEVDQDLSNLTVQDNVIKMYTPNKMTASGVMITENGFFVSAYHAIKGLEDTFAKNDQKGITRITAGDFLLENVEYQVIDTKGKRYSLDTSFMIADPKHDLALFKAIKPGKVKPLTYNMSNRPAEKDEALVLVAMNSGLYVGDARIKEINQKVGSKRYEKTREDLLFAEGYIEPGYSGGAIIDQAGSLHGIIKGGLMGGPKQCIVGIPSIYVSYLIGKASKYFEELAQNKKQERN